MSRLTHKVDDKYYPNMNNIVQQKDYEVPNYRTLIHTKLGKLEDLEEELGCPLEVFVNIFKYGVIVFDDNYEANGFSEWTERNIEIDIQNKCFSVYCVGTWYFKDYKKTWWIKGDNNE